MSREDEKDLRIKVGYVFASMNKSGALTSIQVNGNGEIISVCYGNEKTGFQKKVCEPGFEAGIIIAMRTLLEFSPDEFMKMKQHLSANYYEIVECILLDKENNNF